MNSRSPPPEDGALTKLCHTPIKRRLGLLPSGPDPVHATLVETAGFEPASKIANTTTSTSVVSSLILGVPGVN